MRKLLKKYKRENALSLRTLATQLGLHPQTLWRYLAGKRIRSDALEKIWKWLNKQNI